MAEGKVAAGRVASYSQRLHALSGSIHATLERHAQAHSGLLAGLATSTGGSKYLVGLAPALPARRDSDSLVSSVTLSTIGAGEGTGTGTAAGSAS